MVLIYSLGYKQASSERDAKEARADLDWQKVIYNSREKIKAKYNNIKYNTPDDWDSIEQLRKIREMQQLSKASSSTDSSNIKN